MCRASNYKRKFIVHNENQACMRKMRKISLDQLIGNNRRKTVQFSASEPQRHEPARFDIDLTPAEFICKHGNDIWYSREEYKKFKAERCKTVRTWRNTTDEEFYASESLRESICIRGFEEFLSRSYFEERRALRKVHHRLVLEEQERQKSLQTRTSSFDIRPIYRQVSHISNLSTRRSQKMAEHDTEEAYHIHREDRKIWFPMYKNLFVETPLRAKRCEHVTTPSQSPVCVTQLQNAAAINAQLVHGCL